MRRKQWMSAWVLAMVGMHAAAAAPPGKRAPAQALPSPVAPGAFGRPPRPVPQTPLDTLVVSRMGIKMIAREGRRSSYGLEARYSGPDGGYLDVDTGDGALEQDVEVNDVGEGQYQFSIVARDDLAVGRHDGGVRVRMCTDATCAQVVAGTTRYIRYSVQVLRGVFDEWETFQRDAAHTGYVPIHVRPNLIVPLWRWQAPVHGDFGINAIATSPGRVYVTDAPYMAPVASLYALDEETGSIAWQHDFADVPALNAPAAADGRVFVTSSGHDDTFLWAFDAADGSLVHQDAFPAQWPHYLAPTIADGVVYTNGGEYNGGVYAFAASDGLALWSARSGDDDMQTPAVRDGRVYYYDDQAGLKIYDAFDGQVLGSIPDPYDPDGGYSYAAAPMLGSADHVIAFSGSSLPTGSSEMDRQAPRPLVDFSPAAGAPRWITGRNYKTLPAIANGVVYAGSNDTLSFDAISEATGRVLWSWQPSGQDHSFHRNVVVTENVVFVSTDRALYAISLDSHKPVWISPTPGTLAISGHGTLYVVSGAEESTGELRAFRMY